MNTTYTEENAAQRRRLHALTDRWTDDELTREVGGGWSVAAKLVHLAFWDQYSHALLAREECGPALSAAEVDAVNEAVRRLSAGIPPRVTVALARDAAEAVDGKLEQITPELEAAIEGAGRVRLLRRSLHRREHLDQIEKALG